MNSPLRQSVVVATTALDSRLENAGIQLPDLLGKILKVVPLGPGSDEEREAARTVLHKLVHSDPRSSSFNATTRSDGLLASAAGKELNEPMKADTVSALATNCLDKLTKISITLLGAPSGNLH